MPNDKETELQLLQKLITTSIANTSRQLDENLNNVDTKKQAESLFSIISKKLSLMPLWVASEKDIDQTKYIIQLFESLKVHYEKNFLSQSSNSEEALSPKRFHRLALFYHFSILTINLLSDGLEKLRQPAQQNKMKNDMALVAYAILVSFDICTKQLFTMLEYYLKIFEISLARAELEFGNNLFSVIEKNHESYYLLAKEYWPNFINPINTESLRSKRKNFEMEIISSEIAIAKAVTVPEINQSLLPTDYQSDLATHVIDVMKRTGSVCDTLNTQINSNNDYRNYLHIYKTHEQLTRDFLIGDNTLFNFTGVTPRTLNFLEFKYRQIKFGLDLLIAAKTIYTNLASNDEQKKENVTSINVHILNAAARMVTTLDQILYTHYCLGQVDQAHQLYNRLKEIMTIIRCQNINLRKLSEKLAFDHYQKRINELNLSCLTEKALWDDEILKKHRDILKKCKEDFSKEISENNLQEKIETFHTLIQIIKNLITKNSSLNNQQAIKVFFSTAHTLVDLFEKIHQKFKKNKKNASFINNMSQYYRQFIGFIHLTNPTRIPKDLINEVLFRCEALTDITKKATIEEVFVAWLSAAQPTIETTHPNCESQTPAAVIREKQTRPPSEIEILEEKYHEEVLNFAKGKQFRDKGTVSEFINTKPELKTLDFQTRCKLVDSLFDNHILPYNQQRFFKNSSSNSPVIATENGTKTPETTRDHMLIGERAVLHSEGIIFIEKNSNYNCK